MAFEFFLFSSIGMSIFFLGMMFYQSIETVDYFHELLQETNRSGNFDRAIFIAKLTTNDKLPHQPIISPVGPFYHFGLAVKSLTIAELYRRKGELKKAHDYYLKAFQSSKSISLQQLFDWWIHVFISNEKRLFYCLHAYSGVQAELCMIQQKPVMFQIAHVEKLMIDLPTIWNGQRRGEITAMFYSAIARVMSASVIYSKEANKKAEYREKTLWLFSRAMNALLIKTIPDFEILNWKVNKLMKELLKTFDSIQFNLHLQLIFHWSVIINNLAQDENKSFELIDGAFYACLNSNLEDEDNYRRFHLQVIRRTEKNVLIYQSKDTLARYRNTVKKTGQRADLTEVFCCAFLSDGHSQEAKWIFCNLGDPNDLDPLWSMEFIDAIANLSIQPNRVYHLAACIAYMNGERDLALQLLEKVQNLEFSKMYQLIVDILSESTTSKQEDKRTELAMKIDKKKETKGLSIGEEIWLLFAKAILNC